MDRQVFLGGACGLTNWRREIAIPMLEAAGISYYDPQLPFGAWTPDHQYEEMRVKEAADVWLFVLSPETRGVASIGEVAYRLGQNRKIALAIEDIAPDAVFEERKLEQKEIDDLNRGRVFLRAMAEVQGVPVFNDIAEATAYAIQLSLQAQQELNLSKVEAIIARTHIPDYPFFCEKIADRFAVQIRKQVQNFNNDKTEEMHGRRWLIEPGADEAQVVRTLLKAVLTWEEHELRERFRFDGAAIFHPHFEWPHQKEDVI